MTGSSGGYSGPGQPTPVVRMLEMPGGGGGGYQSHEHSPRDSHSTSPPSLTIPTGTAHSSKDISPVDSPHSHSPPGHPGPPHQLQLAPPQLHHPSPHKEGGVQFASMTPMSVPGFPPPVSHTASMFSHTNADPFSALGQLGQDLRLSHPHITQWLQQAQPQPPSPVKNEPMSPRGRTHHTPEQEYAAL